MTGRSRPGCLSTVAGCCDWRSCRPLRCTGKTGVQYSTRPAPQIFPGVFRYYLWISGYDPCLRATGGRMWRKPLKMPGLPNGPFSENRVKRPDSIRGRSFVSSANGARNTVFKIWVSFRSGTVQKGNRGGPEITSRRIAIRGFQRHYMRPELGVFRRSGCAVWPDYRRQSPSPTVAARKSVSWCPGIIRKKWYLK